MGEYVDLAGVKGGKLKPKGKHFARTVTGFMNILRNGRVCSGAGDYGAATVWIDDEGAYRCSFDRNRVTVNEVCVGTQIQVKRWLKEWLPKMDTRDGDKHA